MDGYFVDVFGFEPALEEFHAQIAALEERARIVAAQVRVPPRSIPLYGRGGIIVCEALVDAADFAGVSRHRWHQSSTGYAERAVRVDGKNRKLKMHNQVFGAVPEACFVDHISCQRLDCTRGNLRLATRSENARNRLKKAAASSRYRGVAWDKDTEKWRTVIQADGVARKIGRFASEEDAARAYDAEARVLHGAFCRVNFPNPGEQSAIPPPA